MGGVEVAQLKVTAKLRFYDANEDEIVGMLIDFSAVDDVTSAPLYPYYSWFFTLGAAFEGDELLVRLGNSDTNVFLVKPSTDEYASVQLEVTLSKYRMPPSTTPLDAWEASVRQPGDPSIPDFKPTMDSFSSEKATGFTTGTGLSLQTASILNGVATNSVKLIAGQNFENYADAIYQFSFVLKNPLPKSSEIRVTCVSESCVSGT